MTDFVIDLGTSIPADFAADVCDRLSYAHELIQKIELDSEDARQLRV